MSWSLLLALGAIAAGGCRDGGHVRRTSGPVSASSAPSTSASTDTNPPRPPPGPCVLGVEGGERIAILGASGVDAIHVVSITAGSRMTLDVLDRTRRGTLSVTLDSNASPHTRVEPTEWALDGGDLRSAPIVSAGALLNARFTATPPNDPSRSVEAPALTTTMTVDETLRFQEIVSATDGTLSAVAGAGFSLVCRDRAGCEADRLGESPENYRVSVSGYPVVAFVFGADALRACSPFLNACTETLYPNPRAVPFFDGGAPPECQSARDIAPDSVAIAIRDGQVASAWRTAHHVSYWRESVDMIGNRTPVSVPLVTGDVGAPVVSIYEHRLTVVWPQRSSIGEPYRLMYAEVPDEGLAGTPAPLDTGVASATAPTLAIDRDGWRIAWVEGDDRSTSIRFGSSSVNLRDAVSRAMTVSATGVRASNPEFESGNGSHWLAWSESTIDSQTAAVRVSPLRCASR